jgi:hypothetical protein
VVSAFFSGKIHATVIFRCLTKLVVRATFGETARMHRLRFALEFIGCAAGGALAGAVFRHSDALYMALFVLGFGLCAGFLAHLVIGLRARWRYHYVAICRFYALALVAIVGFALVANATNRADKQVARDYLKQIQPQLEDYHQINGHYPDALSDIPQLPPAPAGFIYQREKDRVPENPDTYRIDYFSEEYWSATQQWQDDD